MSNLKEMTCIVCPNSCRLRVAYNDKKVTEVSDALCRKGIEYAENEIFNPVRSLTTTVKVKNGILPLVSVRSNKPIPKDKIMEAVKLVKALELEAPVRQHQAVLNNILGTGADIITTREIEKA
ncbi:MAG: DUF1667 domain-containing protein [Clostridia bacterium]|nr:DUF1667 domain-containing protein [Clostridia bacterium]